MTAPTPIHPLQPLFARLQACPSRDDRVTEQRFRETWGALKTVAPEHGDTITPALLVGVILYDPETFASLLNAAEHAQLTALGQVALERYLELTHPPHRLGPLLAAAFKELP